MTSIRIGFGCTLLERGLNGAHLDGIGIYAGSLYREIQRIEEVSVSPVCFPPKPWERPLARHFPGSTAFGSAYGISAAISAATSLPFPGAARLEDRMDVFHAPDLLIPKMSRVPVVATICDALPVKRPDWINAGFRGFRSFLVKSSAKWARQVIAISAAMVPDLVEYFGIPEESISVVHLGIAQEWFEPVPQVAKDAFLAKYQLAPGYFLFVGTLQPRKNVETIVAAYEGLPQEIRSDRKLVIAGQQGWGSEQLVARLRSLHTEGKCSWLQYVPASDLKVLYQCAGAFVFPSLWEGFGIPVLEAFASGVPVITSNLSSLPEVAGDAAVLVDPCSVSELRAAMTRISADTDLVLSLAAKGRVRAEGFSWNLCASRTLEVYRKAL